MQYLAAIDYAHLDNGVFLSSLARSISQQNDVRPILIHGDSEYTERIIQTGVMREEATIRSIKDLNHRLIALLADQGVSTIGINGFQREIITLINGELNIDLDYFKSLPPEPALLLSTLVLDKESGKVRPVDLNRFADFLKGALLIEEFFIFSASEQDELFTEEKKPEKVGWQEMSEQFHTTFIPEEFQRYGKPVRLTTAREFDRIPILDKTSLIE